MKVILCITLVLSSFLLDSTSFAGDTETNNIRAVGKVLSSISIDTNFVAVSNPENTNDTIMKLLASPEHTKLMDDFSSHMLQGNSNLVLSEALANTNLMGTNHWSDFKSVLTDFKKSIPANFTNSAWAEVDSAANFLQELKSQSNLPGTSKDSTGTISTDNLDLTGMKEAKFPFSLTLHVTSIGDSLTNHYTVMRASVDAAWQLKKAWRTDTEGHTAVEWPLK